MIKSSSSYTNTKNVVFKEGNLVQSRLQKVVPQLLLKTNVITSCSHINTQSGVADAALPLKVDHLTNSGTFTQLMLILLKLKIPITNSRLSLLPLMKSLTKARIRLPKKSWRLMLLISM